MAGALDGMVATAAPAAQSGLFDTPEIGAFGGRESAVSETKRGPGRPEGSSNRATADRRKFYLSRYTDPLEGAIAFALPADLLEAIRRARALARLIGCKPLEMLDFMRKAGVDAMPYLHTKAVDLNVQGKIAHAHIGLGVVPAPGAVNPGGIEQLRQWFEAEIAGGDAALIEGSALDMSESENSGNSDA